METNVIKVATANQTMEIIELPEDAVYNPAPESTVKNEVKTPKRMFVLIDTHADVVGIYGNKKRLFEKIETLIGESWSMKLPTKNLPQKATYNSLVGAMNYVDSVQYLSPEGKVQYKVCESQFNAS